MLHMKMFVTKKGYVMLCNTCYDVSLKSSKHEEVSFSHEFISLGRRCLKHFSEVKGLKNKKKRVAVQRRRLYEELRSRL